MQYNLICAEEWLSLFSKIKPLFFSVGAENFVCTVKTLHFITSNISSRSQGILGSICWCCVSYISACMVQRMHLVWSCSKLQIATWVRTARNFWFITRLILKIKPFWEFVLENFICITSILPFYPLHDHILFPKFKPLSSFIIIVLHTHTHTHVSMHTHIHNL